jgi:hypothetical protein
MLSRLWAPEVSTYSASNFIKLLTPPSMEYKALGGVIDGRWIKGTITIEE